MHIFLLEKSLGKQHLTVQGLDLKSQRVVALKKNTSKLWRATVAELLVSTQFTGPTVLYLVLSPTKWYSADTIQFLFRGFFYMNRVAPAVGIFWGHGWSKVSQKTNFPFNLHLAIGAKATTSFKSLLSVLTRLGLVRS